MIVPDQGRWVRCVWYERGKGRFVVPIQQRVFDVLPRAGWPLLVQQLPFSEPLKRWYTGFTLVNHCI